MRQAIAQNILQVTPHESVVIVHHVFGQPLRGYPVRSLIIRKLVVVMAFVNHHGERQDCIFFPRRQFVKKTLCVHVIGFQHRLDLLNRFFCGSYSHIWSEFPPSLAGCQQLDRAIYGWHVSRLET